MAQIDIMKVIVFNYIDYPELITEEPSVVVGSPTKIIEPKFSVKENKTDKFFSLRPRRFEFSVDQAEESWATGTDMTTAHDAFSDLTNLMVRAYNNDDEVIFEGIISLLGAFEYNKDVVKLVAYDPIVLFADSDLRFTTELLERHHKKPHDFQDILFTTLIDEYFILGTYKPTFDTSWTIPDWGLGDYRDIYDWEGKPYQFYNDVRTIGRVNAESYFETYFEFTVVSHDKTEPDIDSVWQDDNANLWILDKIISPTALIFKQSGHTDDPPSADTLTYVSGATHTDDIDYTGTTMEELENSYDFSTIQVYRWTLDWAGNLMEAEQSISEVAIEFVGVVAFVSNKGRKYICTFHDGYIHNWRNDVSNYDDENFNSREIPHNSTAMEELRGRDYEALPLFFCNYFASNVPYGKLNATVLRWSSSVDNHEVPYSYQPMAQWYDPYSNSIYYFTVVSHALTDSDINSVYEDDNSRLWKLKGVVNSTALIFEQDGHGYAPPKSGDLTWVSGGDEKSAVTYTNETSLPYHNYVDADSTTYETPAEPTIDWGNTICPITLTALNDLYETPRREYTNRWDCIKRLEWIPVLSGSDLQYYIESRSVLNFVPTDWFEITGRLWTGSRIIEPRYIEKRKDNSIVTMKGDRNIYVTQKYDVFAFQVSGNWYEAVGWDEGETAIWINATLDYEPYLYKVQYDYPYPLTDANMGSILHKRGNISKHVKYLPDNTISRSSISDSTPDYDFDVPTDGRPIYYTFSKLLQFFLASINSYLSYKDGVFTFDRMFTVVGDSIPIEDEDISDWKTKTTNKVFIAADTVLKPTINYTGDALNPHYNDLASVDNKRATCRISRIFNDYGIVLNSNLEILGDTWKVEKLDDSIIAYYGVELTKLNVDPT